MVHRHQIEAQLKRLGVSIKNWGAAEVRELPQILMDDEEITGYVHGWYENGFATLLATTDRVLLIDKKLFTLTIEDIRYDMIAEVDYNGGMMDATVRINTINKSLRFTSVRVRRLRALTTYVQHRVMLLHHQNFSRQFDSSASVAATATPVAQPQTRLAVQGPGSMPLTASAPLQPAMKPLTTFNPYSKPSLTTSHQFLPKVPRRWRPK